MLIRSHLGKECLDLRGVSGDIYVSHLAHLVMINVGGEACLGMSKVLLHACSVALHDGLSTLFTQ